MNAINKLPKTEVVKLFASFNRGIFIPLIAPNNTPEIIHQRLKKMGARIGRDSVELLMNGSASVLKDFEVVTVTDRHIEVKSPVIINQAIPQISNEPATQEVTQSIQAIPVVKTSLKKGKARSLGYPPQRSLVPLRRDTVYAKLMEMMMGEGATFKELLAASGNASLGGVNNLLGGQIKQKGYGVKYDPKSEKYTIVLPVGVTKLIYEGEY